MSAVVGTSGGTREQLIAAIAGRGLTTAAATVLAKRFGDDELAGAFRLIDRFDEKKQRSPGLLVRMLEQDTPPPERMDSVDRRHRQFDQARAWARANGFTERQAPFAAMAQLTINALGGPKATAEQVRTRVRAQYPWLFEDADDAF